MYGFQSQACVHPASVDYTKCAVSVTANILLLIQRSVLSSVDMIYHLSSAPFKEQLPNQIQQIEFEQDAPTKKWHDTSLTSNSSENKLCRYTSKKNVTAKYNNDNRQPV